METLGVDCMLVTPSPDMKYLLGLSIWPDERLMTAVFAPGHRPFLIANRLLALSLTESPYPDILYWQDGQEPYTLLARELKRRNIPTDKLAVDNALAAGILVPLIKTLPVKSLCCSAEITAPLRMYKDEAEMENLRIACQKASEALRITMRRGREWIGHTEAELASALCTEMVKQGLAYGSASVSVGKNSAEPHHLHTDAVIEDNMGMWIDFGSTYNHYNTDMTRAFYFGEPDPDYAKLAGIVNEAREAGIAAAKVGNPLGAVDAAARGVVESYGYGEFFIHNTGHGIGIMNHEGPSASPGEMTPIAPGMAFSVEPGIYLPGRFGIRVEDEILIDGDGNAQRLHDFPADLTVFR